jgi:hypothetical protein
MKLHPPPFDQFRLYPLCDIPNHEGFRLTVLDAFGNATSAVVVKDSVGLHYLRGFYRERLPLSEFTSWVARPAVKGGAAF